MIKILILMTKSATLTLTDGRQHASGFWAEEFVVPYERFVGKSYAVEVATIGGEAPTPDKGSLTPQVVGNTRPIGSPDRDAEDVAHYQEVISSLDVLHQPTDVSDITRPQLEGYDGVYISGGHGAMEEMPHDVSMTRAVRHGPPRQR